MLRVFIFIFILLSLPIHAQIIDTVQLNDSANIIIENDTTDHNEKSNFWNAEPHSPGKAALFSVVPGLGQAYNKKYWKIPIVYTALGISGYAIWFNAFYFNDLKDAYLIRTDGDSSTIDEYELLIPSESSLLQYAEYYKKNLDLSVIIFSAIYILNIVDAVVDAHLFDFDISDDLSLHIDPYYRLPLYATNNFTNTSSSFGLKLKLTLK